MRLTEYLSLKYKNKYLSDKEFDFWIYQKQRQEIKDNIKRLLEQQDQEKKYEQDLMEKHEKELTKQFDKLTKELIDDIFSGDFKINIKL